MKKSFALFCICILLISGAPFVAASGNDDLSFKDKAITLETRGLLNLLTFLGEIPKTYILETKVHSKAWPVTGFPRALKNVITRATSSVLDIFMFPLYAGGEDNMQPMTRQFDLPDYLWLKE